jgi:hypothetical protein
VILLWLGNGGSILQGNAFVPRGLGKNGDADDDVEKGAFLIIL